MVEIVKEDATSPEQECREILLHLRVWELVNSGAHGEPVNPDTRPLRLSLGVTRHETGKRVALESLDLVCERECTNG